MSDFSDFQLPAGLDSSLGRNASENKDGREGESSASASSTAAAASPGVIDRLLPLNELRESAKTELLDVIDSLRGVKCLVVQSELGGLLNQVLVEGSRTLKGAGVQFFRELRGDLGDFAGKDGVPGSRAAPENVVYLVRPSLPHMRLIAHQIQSSLKAGVRTQFHVYFVPYRTVACEQLLEDEGVLGHCEVGEFNLGLVPFDTDLLSLEMADVFRQCYVDGDTSSLGVVASALHDLQAQFGVIPFVKGKGAAAKKVLQSMMHLRVEKAGAGFSAPSSSSAAGADSMWGFSASASALGLGGDAALSGGAQGLAPGGKGWPSRRCIHSLIVLDREVDLVSPMVTPLTYEGLIDDVVGIDNGKVRLDASLLGSDESIDSSVRAMAGPSVSSALGAAGVGGSASTGGGGGMGADSLGSAQARADKDKDKDKVLVPLNNTDVVFAEIRDLSIERLGGYLQEKAVRIKQLYATFRENKDASISEIHDFVKKIPALTREYKSLHQHIHVAELLKRTTDSADFRDQWQLERAVLEGEVLIEQIEEILSADVEGKHMYRVLRLLCLQSHAAGGIRSNRYDAIRREILQTYGYSHLFLLANLEKAGLLRRKDLALVDATPSWHTVRNQLRLIDDAPAPAAASGAGPGRPGLGYVSAGYAPLTARIVQAACKSAHGWKDLADVLKLLPGSMMSFTQVAALPEEYDEALKRTAVDEAAAAAASAVTGSAGAGSLVDTPLDDAEGEGGKKVLLVLILGGLSFLEIAAFRHLSNDPAFPFKIVMATTKLCNGSGLLKSVNASSSAD